MATTGERPHGWQVGELARAAKVSVRALRYYDQIGLLTPARRARSGHRLYDDADVRRLYRICLLRRIGLGLSEIARALDEPDWQLHNALPAHLEMLEHQLAVTTAARRRVASIVSAIDTDHHAPTSAFLGMLEDLAMLETNVQRRIAILVYDDIPAMHAWLTRTFALSAGRLTYDDAGTCIHGEVHAGDGAIWLHQVSPRWGLNSPRALGAATGTTAVMVEDVDAHHLHATSHDAEILYEPTDMPYGYREYSARDPEGVLWSFMKPL